MRYFLIFLLAAMLAPGRGVAQQKKEDSARTYRNFVIERGNKAIRMVNALADLPLNRPDSIKTFINNWLPKLDTMMSKVCAMGPFRNSTYLRDAGAQLLTYYSGFLKTFLTFIPPESDSPGKVHDFIVIDSPTEKGSIERAIKLRYTSAIADFTNLVKKK